MAAQLHAVGDPNGRVVFVEEALPVRMDVLWTLSPFAGWRPGGGKQRWRKKTKKQRKKITVIRGLKHMYCDSHTVCTLSATHTISQMLVGNTQLASDFCLHWEKVQSAVIREANDSDTVVVGIYRLQLRSAVMEMCGQSPPKMQLHVGGGDTVTERAVKTP